MSEHLNYFTGVEKKKQNRLCAARNRFFHPLLVTLDKLGVTPDIISFLSLLCMVGFVYFVPTNMLVALIFIIPHIVLDGIDGCLARYQGSASNAGALTDIFVDQIGLVVAILALIYYGMIDPFWSAWYMAMYMIMIMFLVLLNRLGSPIRFAFRSKYFFYLVLLIDLYVVRDIVPPFLALFAIYMTIHNIYFFMRMRKVV